MRLRKPLAVAAAGALAVSLAACGGGGSNGASGSSGSSDSAKFQNSDNAGATKDPKRQGPAEPVPDAVKGGTVTVLFPSPDTGPATLDPTAGWSVTGNSIQQALVNRSLTTFAQDPKTKKMVLVPDLATDLGQHNADFTEWSFTLKDGMKYDNGNPVKAEDIAFAISRSFDAGDLAGAGTQYSTQYFLDGDTYKGPYDKASAKKPYAGTTVSGNKITIKMSQPFPDMDYWGTFMAMGPIPQGKISTPPTYGNKPLATGPYKVESFNPEKELVLVRNANWDPSSDPARHNYPDKYIFKFDQDAATTDALVLSKNASASTTITSSVLADNYAKAKQQLGERLVQGSSPCTAFWSPDFAKISDLKVRQAIALAYPYENAWSAGGEVVGVTRTPGSSILPPGIAGREAYKPINGSEVKTDVEGAKKLLADAGVKPNTFTVSWVYKQGDPQAAAARDQIAAGLKKAGFKTKPLPYDGSLYDVWTAADDDNGPAGRLKKQINMKGVAWCSDWPSALTFIPPLLQSGQTYNTGKFSETSVDDAIKSIVTKPAAEQPAEWAKLDKDIETKYLPLINLGYTNNLMIYGTKIGNFNNDEVFGAPNYKDLFVKK